LLKVNGDDCILGGSRHLFHIWKQVVKVVGLESSVGKTYFDKKLAVMNSMTFIRKLSWENDGSFEEIQYVNLGLVKGQSKSGEIGKFHCQLASLHKELKRTCPVENWDRANRIFFHAHKNQLKEFDVPWYLPQWCGGYGLQPPQGHDFQKDLKKLSFRIHEGEKFRPPPSDKDWNMHELTRDILKDDLWVVDNCYWKSCNGDRFDKAYGFLIMNTLFKYGLSELKTLVERIRSAQSYRRIIVPPKEIKYWKKMEKAWKTAKEDFVGTPIVLDDVFVVPNKPELAVLIC
jgi:hypothetical protein